MPQAGAELDTVDTVGGGGWTVQATEAAPRARGAMAAGVRLLRPASLVAIVAALLAPGLVEGPDQDAAVFVLMGIRIRAGGMPYRDLWDHKPPGAYLLNALGQSAFPWLDPWLVSWVLSVVCTALAILLLDRLLRRRVSSRMAWFWSCVCAVTVACYPRAIGGGYTETFALLPLVAALWLVDSRRGSWPVAAVIGGLLGIACLLSIQSIPAAAALAVAAAFTTEGLRVSARRSAALLTAGLVPLLLVLAWLGAGGALGDAVDQLLVYSGAYRASSPGLPGILPLAVLPLTCFLIPAGVAVVRMVVRPRSSARVDWVCVAWLLGSLALVGYENRIYLHYLIPVAPPLAVLAAPACSGLWNRIGSPRASVRRLAFGLSAGTIAMVLMAAVFTGEATVAMLVNASWWRNATSATADWVRGNTPTSARMFVWGNVAQLYLAANRAPYGHYMYEFPITTAGYWSAQKTQALVEAWEADPPDIVVESLSDVPLFQAKTESGDGRGYDSLEPLREFIRGHYRLAASTGGLEVYLLTAPATPSG